MRPGPKKDSGDRHERGLRVTMLTGFALVIGLTILIAGWSYYNIATLGTAAENLFIANYRSIQYAYRMDSAVAVISSDFEANEATDQKMEVLDHSFRSSLRDEYQNITEPGELQATQRLEQDYVRFLTGVGAAGVGAAGVGVRDPVSGARADDEVASQAEAQIRNPGHRKPDTGYRPLASIRTDAITVRKDIATILSINERAMFLRADTAKELATFARYSTLLITLALVIVAIMLAFGVSRRSLAEFRELDRAKSNFVATAAHELKNPLSSIKTATGMMLDGIAGPVTERQSEMLRNVRTESERLLTLVRELLDLAKLETGTLQLTLEPIGIQDLIESSLLPAMMTAERAGVHLDIRIAPETPKLLADPNKISWALTNLVINAIRYSPRNGNVTITASEIDNEVWIAVTDEGGGISPKDLERIFEKFVQVEDAAMGGGTGSGLGLSIAKEIVLAHRGRIWADSTLGKGSTFTLAIPITRTIKTETR